MNMQNIPPMIGYIRRDNLLKPIKLSMVYLESLDDIPLLLKKILIDIMLYVKCASVLHFDGIFF